MVFLHVYSKLMIIQTKIVFCLDSFGGIIKDLLYIPY